MNVLLISVDDLRPELGCYGAEIARTPHMDRLAEEGVLFERAYCQQALCTPSRTSVLTGLRPASSGVGDLRTHFRDTVPDVLTLPQHFRQSGYRTISLGKVFHSEELDDPASWSEPAWRPAVEARDYVLPTNVARSAAHPRGCAAPYEAADLPDNAYRDGRVTDKAIEILKQAREEPLFLAVGYYKPHLPFNAPQRYWDLYDFEAIAPSPVPDLPVSAPRAAWRPSSELRMYDEIPRRAAIDGELARRLVHGYLACVSYVDAQIGRLLQELERAGLSDRTVVVLWSDHGWHLGDHDMWGKNTNFEIAARVPLIVRAPGRGSPGSRSLALVELVDLFPTLCEIAGLPLPSHLEGRSFAPLLDEPDLKWKSGAFTQRPYALVSRSSTRIVGYSVRTDRYRFTRWVRGASKTVGLELYDHAVDSRETLNLAADPRHAAQVEDLTEQLQVGWKGALQGAGDSERQPTGPPGDSRDHSSLPR